MNLIAVVKWVQFLRYKKWLEKHVASVGLDKDKILTLEITFYKNQLKLDLITANTDICLYEKNGFLFIETFLVELDNSPNNIEIKCLIATVTNTLTKESNLGSIVMSCDDDGVPSFYLQAPIKWALTERGFIKSLQAIKQEINTLLIPTYQNIIHYIEEFVVVPDIDLDTELAEED